ncbi:hypothetical protein BDV30DRAFT_108147 [Aspergillus minisclerotigenes]|uniref:Uncharacterized protein n=1 Tax=Aspergillus minisclerotigenes TaxID=656917 RepID=A0A5N6J632_9EURO|nr:hypothetical protein BDV30DRAFT_108147 [Aspergillus minisclerotigenes]
MNGSGRLRLEFVIARSGVSLVKSLSHFDSTSPGDLPWFWVQLWRSAPVDPRPISIFFCTVTEHFHGITKIGGWALLFLFIFFRLRFSLSGSPCTEDLVAMWNGVRLRSWIRGVVYHGKMKFVHCRRFRNFPGTY